MKTTYHPGQRLTKGNYALHIKAVRQNGCMTTRGFKSFDDLATFTAQPYTPPRPSGKNTSVRLTLADFGKCALYFGNPSAAVRWAIAKQEGKI
jgi:hypothetical protein